MQCSWLRNTTLGSTIGPSLCFFFILASGHTCYMLHATCYMLGQLILSSQSADASFLHIPGSFPCSDPRSAMDSSSCLNKDYLSPRMFHSRQGSRCSSSSQEHSHRGKRHFLAVAFLLSSCFPVTLLSEQLRPPSSQRDRGIC